MMVGSDDPASGFWGPLVVIFKRDNLAVKLPERSMNHVYQQFSQAETEVWMDACGN